MSVLSAKRLLIRTTRIDTFKTVRIGQDMNFLGIVPVENKQLWARNHTAYRKLIELAGEQGILDDLSTFTSYLRRALDDERVERPIENNWDQLYRFIALAIHCYLLTYTETIRYETDPEWFIGRTDEKHNWINDTNMTTKRIGQMLGESPILFYSV